MSFQKNKETVMGWDGLQPEDFQIRTAKPCGWCDCEGYHECLCGREMTEKQCHETQGKCVDCQYDDDFANKFGGI